MIGKIYILRSGYDPEKGKHVNDPYLGDKPTMGACRPDIRERLQKGDHIFAVSGKVHDLGQTVLGGFEIAEKINAIDAYERFPDQRIHLLPNGQVAGNIIVTSGGGQHELDYHNQFDRRIQNHVVGTNPVALLSSKEVALGRCHSLEILREVFKKNGNSVGEIIGRCSNLTEKQIEKLRELLQQLKDVAVHSRPMESLANGNVRA